MRKVARSNLFKSKPEASFEFGIIAKMGRFTTEHGPKLQQNLCRVAPNALKLIDDYWEWFTCLLKWRQFMFLVWLKIGCPNSKKMKSLFSICPWQFFYLMTIFGGQLRDKLFSASCDGLCYDGFCFFFFVFRPQSGGEARCWLWLFYLGWIMIQWWTTMVDNP